MRHIRYIQQQARMPQGDHFFQHAEKRTGALA